MKKSLHSIVSQPEAKELEEFCVLSEALLFAMVCSSLPQEEVVLRMRGWPCGTREGWQFSDKPFGDEQPNPCPCNESPATHKHYLFEC